MDDFLDEFFRRLGETIESAIRKAGEPPSEEEPVKVTRGDLIKLVNESVKGVESQFGQQNRNVIKAIFAEHGATKVPEIPDNQLAEVCRKIKERRVG